MKIKNIFNVLAAAFVVYTVFIVETTIDLYKVRIVFNNEIIQISQKFSYEELSEIYLKSNNDILFTDGEYFFESAPSNPSTYKCKIVETMKVQESSIDYKLCVFTGFIILLLFINVPPTETSYDSFS